MLDQEQGDHVLTGTRLAAALGLCGPSGIGIALMAITFPHLSPLFLVGFAIAILGAIGASWLAIFEFKKRLRARWLVACVATAAVVAPIAVLSVAVLQKSPVSDGASSFSDMAAISRPDVPDGSIAITCNDQSYPREVPAGRKVYEGQFVQPERAQIEHSFGEFEEGPYPIKWGGDPPDGYKCQIKNFSGRPLLGINGNFRYQYQDRSKGDINVIAEGSINLPNAINLSAASPGDSEDFYFWNHSDYLVAVLPPNDLTVYVPGHAERITVHTRIYPGSFYVFFSPVPVPATNPPASSPPSTGPPTAPAATSQQ